jgi:general secretion pathway protein J
MYKFSLYLHPVSSVWHQSQPHGLSIINQKMKPPKLRPVKDPNGFTLLEILLAIFILATVLSTVFASYTGSLRVVSETESQAESYQMARVALERMLEDLESFYPEPKDKENPISGGNNTSLRFLSRAHVVFSEEDQSWGTTAISYEVEEGDGGEGKILYRRETPQGEQEDPSGGGEGRLPLCEKLWTEDPVKFSYYDAEGKEMDNWDPSAEEELKMVSVALQFINPSDPEVPLKFATSVYLRVVRVDAGDVNAGD